MIINYNKEHYNINLDWLSFSGKLRDDPELMTVECPMGLDCEICKGTQQYRCRAIFSDPNGMKIFTALWVPVSKAIGSRMILFEVANEYLYNNRLAIAYAAIQTAFDFVYNNPSRIDIACDFELTRKKKSIVKGLYHGNLYVANKRHGNDWWHDNREVHQMSWGNKHSQYKWKLYNKSRELGTDTKLENYEKPYIVEDWMIAGMNIRNVWRLEISMTGCSRLNYYGKVISIKDIMDNAFIVQVFMEEMERRFVVRKRENHSRASNDTQVNIIPLKFEKVNLTTRASKEVKVYAGLREFFGIVKLLRESKTIQTSTQLSSMFVELAKTIVAKYHLGTHLLWVYKKSYEDIINDAIYDNLAKYGQNY